MSAGNFSIAGCNSPNTYPSIFLYTAELIVCSQPHAQLVGIHTELVEDGELSGLWGHSGEIGTNQVPHVEYKV